MTNSSNHGGARPGAGRKKGSGPYGEPTRVMRVPASKVAIIKHWLTQQAQPTQQPDNADFSTTLNRAGHQIAHPDFATSVSLPLYSHKVTAGFPSPADDYIENRLDLNQKLIREPQTTFLVTVEGDSMQDAGIERGDLLVVDRGLSPQDGDIVIASIHEDVTVKRLKIEQEGLWLVPENSNYPPIPVKDNHEITLWGVVTATIKQFKR
ncbi:LexA family transcriptional regulator [Thiomicrospira sp. WB1]|uniref:LexA family protein n=1 Tax=Thiomicrospira sp. WB1 TaxID=1685380 RepID=UPI000747E044|nr:translesion error-prone DNA polymerase V autoproteolytic subunit [Thiomicrospira sp. WB1]KUJ71572.1 DNA polymerase V [Thiomicrospira sp. WB1]